ncbi:hypothetical protein CDIK_1503 [Cucumispora dikerogammari]|nr:hypothetical protein CDIK_1503 [Cucumispora dikerogammari]
MTENNHSNNIQDKNKIRETDQQDTSKASNLQNSELYINNKHFIEHSDNHAGVNDISANLIVDNTHKTIKNIDENQNIKKKAKNASENIANTNIPYENNRIVYKNNMSNEIGSLLNHPRFTVEIINRKPEETVGRFTESSKLYSGDSIFSKYFSRNNYLNNKNAILNPASRTCSSDVILSTNTDKVSVSAAVADNDYLAKLAQTNLSNPSSLAITDSIAPVIINNSKKRNKIEPFSLKQNKISRIITSEAMICHPVSINDSISNSSKVLADKSNKIFNILTKKNDLKQPGILNNTTNPLYSKTNNNIKHVGPFKTLKIYSETRLCFTTDTNSTNDIKDINKIHTVKLRKYYKYPHKQIVNDKSKLFISIQKIYVKALESVFKMFMSEDNFIYADNSINNPVKEFYILLGKKVLLFSNKTAYIPKSLQMELIDHGIELLNLIPNTFTINNSSNKQSQDMSAKHYPLYNPYIKNKLNITNSRDYFTISDEINLLLLIDYLSNNDCSSVSLPLIFSTYEFSNCMVYNVEVVDMGQVQTFNKKNNIGVNDLISADDNHISVTNNSEETSHRPYSNENKFTALDALAEVVNRNPEAPNYNTQYKDINSPAIMYAYKVSGYALIEDIVCDMIDECVNTNRNDDILNKMRFVLK